MGLRTVFKTGLTDVATTDKEGIGTIRWENNKCYKYVKYKEGTATLDVVAGDFVMYDDIVANNVLADQTDIAAAAIGAGAIVAAVTETDRFIWIQIKGPCTLAVAIGSGTDGCVLTAEGAADKAVKIAAEADSTADYVHTCGVAVDASAKEVLLDCPF